MITAKSAVCGHPGCDPYERRISVLDDLGDVVIYSACDGTRWVFRDDVCHGLTLISVGGFTTLSRQDENWAAVHIRPEGDLYVARWQPLGTVAARWDTRYGLIAKMARRMLKPAACCKDGAL